MNRFGIMLIGTALLALAPDSARAETPEAGVRRLKVEYSDLDLSSAAGQARLQQRLRAAASRLCLDHGVHPLRVQVAQRRCLAEAIEAAQPRIAELVSRHRPATFASDHSAFPTTR